MTNANYARLKERHFLGMTRGGARRIWIEIELEKITGMYVLCAHRIYYNVHFEQCRKVLAHWFLIPAFRADSRRSVVCKNSAVVENAISFAISFDNARQSRNNRCCGEKTLRPVEKAIVGRNSPVYLRA